MITWTRAVLPVLCGRCGEMIQPGDPLQEIRVGKMRHGLRRCSLCGGGAPPDLPLDMERTRPALRGFERFNLTREPGEDDQ